MVNIVTRLGTTPEREARLVDAGLDCLVGTGYWALRTELIIYVC